MSPMPVEIANWSPTAYGVSILVIVQLFMLTGLIVKNGPQWIAEWTNRRKQEQDHEKSDLDELKDAVRAMNERLNRMGQAMTFMTSAATMTTNALEVLEPGHIAIQQSRELIQMAVASLGVADPFSPALAKLAQYPHS